MDWNPPLRLVLEQHDQLGAPSCHPAGSTSSGHPSDQPFLLKLVDLRVVEVNSHRDGPLVPLVRLAPHTAPIAFHRIKITCRRGRINSTRSAPPCEGAQLLMER